MSIKLTYSNKPVKGTRKKIALLEETFKDATFRGKLADFVMAMVYKRVKSGYGVSSLDTPTAETAKVRLKPLTPSYKERRKQMQLGFGGTPGKSNLTATGQMLEAMRKSLKGVGFSVYIAATSRRGSKLTNAKLAQYVSQQGRPFMRLTSGEARLVKSEMKLQLKMKLRQLR